MMKTVVSFVQTPSPFTGKCLTDLCIDIYAINYTQNQKLWMNGAVISVMFLTFNSCTFLEVINCYLFCEGCSKSFRTSIFLLETVRAGGVVIGHD